MKSNHFVKVLAVFLFCSIFTVGINAQNTFSHGDNNINLGIGIGSTLGGHDYKTTLPTLSISYERCIIDQLFDNKSSLGIGGYFGYATNKTESKVGKEKFGYNYSYVIFGARGALHYHLLNKLDTYGGLFMGYNIVRSETYGNWGDYSSPASGSTLGWSIFVGARYFFHENIAAFTEFGYGIAILQLGITFKF